MFEEATRLKLRFDTSLGMLSIEDLWDLPLTSRGENLDNIARGLHRKLKNDDDVSFVEPDRKSDTTIQLMFDIVRHVIDVRLREKAAADEKKANAEKKQKLLSILSDKEDEGLRSLTVDELREAIKAL